MGLTLDELKDASGVSKPYLSEIERGTTRPSAEKLDAILAILDKRGGDTEGFRDELDKTELIERHGLESEAADAAITLNRLEADARVELAEMAKTLDRLDAQERRHAVSELREVRNGLASHADGSD